MPMKALKYSRQRECIKDCLMRRHDHPTADTLYMSIREEFPNISLGTVYRNLNLLVDLGEIRKLSCGSGPDRFDGDTSPHYHFVCRHCGRVFDLSLRGVVLELPDKEGLMPGHIEGYSLICYGTCNSCIGTRA